VRAIPPLARYRTLILLLLLLLCTFCTNRLSFNVVVYPDRPSSLPSRAKTVVIYCTYFTAVIIIIIIIIISLYTLIFNVTIRTQYYNIALKLWPRWLSIGGLPTSILYYIILDIMILEILLFTYNLVWTVIIINIVSHNTTQYTVNNLSTIVVFAHTILLLSCCVYTTVKLLLLARKIRTDAILRRNNIYLSVKKSNYVN